MKDEFAIVNVEIKYKYYILAKDDMQISKYIYSNNKIHCWSIEEKKFIFLFKCFLNIDLSHALRHYDAKFMTRPPAFLSVNTPNSKDSNESHFNTCSLVLHISLN